MDKDLWRALRSADPVGQLTALATAWRDAGVPQDEAERRLTAFRAAVVAAGEDEDPVLDVLDLVVGWSHPSARIYQPEAR
jgi:hypothetical protein